MSVMQVAMGSLEVKSTTAKLNLLHSPSVEEAAHTAEVNHVKMPIRLPANKRLPFCGSDPVAFQ